jgi:peroxiredoxin
VLALLSVLVVLLALILLTLWAVLYQLVKQQGRMLLRLDGVEYRLGYGIPAAQANGLPALGVLRGPSGPAVGTPVESLQLPNLEGRTVALDEFRGKPLLLVNWNPQCGYCDLLAPDLARLLPQFKERGVGLALLARGSAEANRKLIQEHGLDVPILLVGDGTATPEVFENQGTPVACLLDAEGRVAKPLAMGADGTLALADEALAGGKKQRIRLPGEKPLSQSKIVRNGLKAGTPAPPFTLPDIYGREVSLADYLGRRVLLVFSDPHCGPCEQLAPELVRLHRSRDDLALILIGRGNPFENRRKAREHGFEFPVVVQKHWELSKEYGIFATPVAFLIGADGVLASNVARGTEEILALTGAGRPTEVSDGQPVR